MGFFDSPMGVQALQDILGQQTGGSGGYGAGGGVDPMQAVRMLQQQQSAPRPNPTMAPQGFGEEPPLAQQPQQWPPAQPPEDWRPQVRSEIGAPAGSDSRSLPPWAPAQSFGGEVPSTSGMNSSPPPASNFSFRPGSFMDRAFGSSASPAEPNEVWAGNPPAPQAPGAAAAADAQQPPPQMTGARSDIGAQVAGGDPRLMRPPLDYGPDSGALPPQAAGAPDQSQVPMPRPRPPMTQQAAQPPMNILPAAAGGPQGGPASIPSQGDREGMAGYAPQSAAMMQPGGAPVGAPGGGPAGVSPQTAQGAASPGGPQTPWLAGALGVDQGRFRRFAAGLGAGLANTGKLYPQGALGAMAGGVGAGIQGAESRGDKDFDQNLKTRADNRAEKGQDFNQKSTALKDQMAQASGETLNRQREALTRRADAQAAMYQNGDFNGRQSRAWQNTDFGRSMEIDKQVLREIEAKRKALQPSLAQMSPEQQKAARDGLDKDFNDLRAARYKQHGIDPDAAARGTSPETPHDLTKLTPSQAAYMPDGQYFTNGSKDPKTGKLRIFRRDYTKNPPPGYNPPAGAAAPPVSDAQAYEEQSVMSQ